MKREFSAGGIVIKQDNGETSVLLVAAPSIKDPEKKNWGFPKGNIEDGESMKDAALREVKEEAGVEAEIIEKVGDSKYVYPREGEKIFKIVSFFLMKYLSGGLKHDWEIAEVKWFTPEDALKTLSFSQDKLLLKKALELMTINN